MKNTALPKKKLRVTDAALRGIMTKVMRKTKQGIRSCGFAPQALPKKVVGDRHEDWTTHIDHGAQRYFVDLLTCRFPGIGIIGEEDGIPPPASSAGNDSDYFLIDPIDGTGALLRRQPASFGPMLTWIQDGIVKGAFVGNIDTGWIFGFGPDSPDVWVTEIPSVHTGWKAETDPRKKDIWDMRVLLRDHPEKHSAVSRRIISRSKKMSVMDGGIGVWMSHLWLGAADIVFMKPGHQIPWDWSPIVGISQKLGFVFLKPGTDGGWEEYVPEISKEMVYRDHDIAIVHRNHLESLAQ